ncbi:hypothetical protein [Sphingopyxis sp.]|uniref:hypothetical protein n=1 Tax=Sphingopyxis sp. TaxID=1908224 RepID=UPI0025FAF9FC|nr:hypothetical protein [Sphingopyxis sp.]MBR2174794.1 hypothetical protein [Sphingopyxis sp.]
MGNEQIGAVVAMMMVAARGGVARFLVAIGRIVMMNGMMIDTVMNDIDGDVGGVLFIVRHHEGRRMLKLIRCLGRNRGRIERHEQSAE